MPEPATLAGVKMSTMIAMGAGSATSSLLMQGPWPLRLVAGLCGATCTFVGTPVLTPLAFKFWAQVYDWCGVASDELSRDSVAGFVGFLLALTGIDICRWLIERTKFGLSILRIPWPWMAGKDAQK